MKLKPRKMKTTAHHGAGMQVHIHNHLSPKAAADSVAIDTMRQIFERTTERELQHGPCYRIDPKTGERTVIG